KSYFIGFNNIYSRIIFIKNSYISKIIRVSIVTFSKKNLVNYKDPICSSNSNIVEYYIIFLN
ncbi:hypothetical protein QR685DRAFT_446316, partial [Neurospora intermedia]